MHLDRVYIKLHAHKYFCVGAWKGREGEREPAVKCPEFWFSLHSYTRKLLDDLIFNIFSQRFVMLKKKVHALLFNVITVLGFIVSNKKS